MAFLAPLIEVGAEAGAGAEAAGAGAAAEGAAEGEGAAGAEDEMERPGGEHDLGNGHSMHISQEQFHALAHSDAVVAAITDRAMKCKDICMELKQIPPAVYDVSVQNSENSSRARARVYAANYKAVVDTQYHDTMLKAAAQTGSDPRIMPSEHEEGPEEEKKGGPEGPEGPEGEAGAEGGEAAAGGELAEVAEVAVAL